MAFTVQASGPGIGDTYSGSLLFLLITNRSTSGFPHISHNFVNIPICIDHSVEITWFVLDKASAFTFSFPGICWAFALHHILSNVNYSSHARSVILHDCVPPCLFMEATVDEMSDSIIRLNSVQYSCKDFTVLITLIFLLFECCSISALVHWPVLSIFPIVPSHPHALASVHREWDGLNSARDSSFCLILSFDGFVEVSCIGCSSSVTNRLCKCACESLLLSMFSPFPILFWWILSLKLWDPYPWL